MRGEGTKLGEGERKVRLSQDRMTILYHSGFLRLSGLLRTGLLRTGLLRTGLLRSARLTSDNLQVYATP